MVDKELGVHNVYDSERAKKQCLNVSTSQTLEKTKVGTESK